jgi:hypothetical protein
MIRYLKSGRTADESAEDTTRVREVVSTALFDIENLGDAAVRDMSAKYDRWEPVLLASLRGSWMTSASPRRRFGDSRRRNWTRSRTWKSRPCPAWC